MIKKQKDRASVEKGPLADEENDAEKEVWQ